MIIALAVLASQSIFPIAELQNAGYKVSGKVKESAEEGVLLMKLPDSNLAADDRSITVSYQAFGSAASPTFLQNQELEGASQLSLRAFQRQTASNWPLGTDVLYRARGHAVTLRCRSKWERVNVVLTEPMGIGAGGQLESPPAEREKHIALAEKCARILLARCAARRLNDSVVTLKINSHDVRTRAHSTGKFADLEDWKIARGLTGSYDSTTCLTTLRKGGLILEIPLAATKLKAGGTWIQMPDLVMEDKGRRYVSLSLLENQL